MSQRDSNRQKRLYAIGGAVFGASAVAALLASYNILLRDDSSSTSSTLRGSSSLPNATSGTDTTPGKGSQYQRISNATSLAPSTEQLYQVISQNATSISTHFAGDRNSNDVAELILTIEAAAHQGNIFADPTLPGSKPMITNETSLYPTYSPTMDIPTFMPTAQDDALPKVLPIKRSDEIGFRLKLYWEEGYYWQENTNERWWCMSCQDGSCVADSKIELRNCETKDDDLDALFVAVGPYDVASHQFRVANSNLCLMKMGRSRGIKLKPCKKPGKKHFELQLFKGFKPNEDEKFELRPSSYLDRCLSNHHHPKVRFG
jgi:hypothetical protein